MIDPTKLPALLSIAQEAEFVARESLRRKPHAPPIRKAREKVERVMQRYFNRQRNAVMGSVLDHHHLIEASGKTNAATLLPAETVKAFSPNASEEADYHAAMLGAMEEARDVLAHDLGLGTVNTGDAIGEYLREHSLSKLTGELNETTLDRLRSAIADAYEAGGGFAEVVDAIKSTFEEFDDVRAGMIAQTEVNAAYNASRHQTARAADLSEKRWEPEGEACELCQANADQGWIGIEDDFDSGEDAPPGHPNCDCGISFRKVTEGEEESDE